MPRGTRRVEQIQAPRERMKREAVCSVNTLKQQSQKRFAGAPGAWGLPLAKWRFREGAIFSLEWDLAHTHLAESVGPLQRDCYSTFDLSLASDNGNREAISI